MEKYFPVTKSSENRDDSKKSSSSARFVPYTTQRHERGTKKNSLLDLLPSSNTPPSSSAVRKLLLKTLKEESNPITHSDLYERTEHLVSMSSGHQVSEGRKNHRLYHDERNHKLAAQKETTTASEQPQILLNVKVYIDGFLKDTTDIEMKRVVTMAGGKILYSASGATHILSSQPLNGSKTHKLLTKKSRLTVHVVKPEWVFDSIKTGKRRPEREYTVLKDSTMMDLSTIMRSKK
ncbi:hypothetical protein BDP27DRAFT_1413949 [Rhodocollybia butyracea]|uniref:BRCT domain-containing protein n=1 Tax=Rhodocollybia butyracea TaxID=206335 RepID=A0A9P5UF18_9AGAR|nr:hypothetical protein BDP27DRAFT_1413949 [Rhodocollybia butyracea]